mgnify:CR=1 FL=1
MQYLPPEITSIIFKYIDVSSILFEIDDINKKINEVYNIEYMHSSHINHFTYKLFIDKKRLLFKYSQIIKMFITYSQLNISTWIIYHIDGLNEIITDEDKFILNTVYN